MDGPAFGQPCVPEIEDVQLEPLEGFQIARRHDVGMGEGKDKTWLVFNRPERIGLGDRACRFQRFADDPVDQRVGPHALRLEPIHKRLIAAALARKPRDNAAQQVSVPLHQFARQQRDARSTRLPAVAEECQKDRGKAERRLILGPVGGAILRDDDIAGIARVRDDILKRPGGDLDENVPIAGHPESAHDALHPNRVIDWLPVAQTAKDDIIAVGIGEAPQSCVAISATRRLCHHDVGHQLTSNPCLMGKERDMCQKETAGAELKDHLTLIRRVWMARRTRPRRGRDAADQLHCC